MNRLLLIALLFSTLNKADAQVLLAYELGKDSLKKVDFSAVEDTSNWAPTPEFVLPDIIFDFNKATLRPQSAEVLDQFAVFLVQHPQLMIEISNHRDCRGADQYSSNLTQRRAQSIAEYLILKGVDERRMLPKGYGDNKPIKLEGNVLSCDYINIFKDDKEKQEKLHQLNRRTEFTIIATNFSE